jgi:hypothetical protein
VFWRLVCIVPFLPLLFACEVPAQKEAHSIEHALVAVRSEQAPAGGERSAKVNGRSNNANEQKAVALVRNNPRFLVPFSRCYDMSEHAKDANRDFENVIRNCLEGLKGDIHVDGWTVRRWDEQTHLVVYRFSINGEAKGFPFEVNTSAEIVRYVIGDSTLERKYGWEQPPSNGGSNVPSQPAPDSYGTAVHSPRTP